MLKQIVLSNSSRHKSQLHLSSRPKKITLELFLMLIDSRPIKVGIGTKLNLAMLEFENATGGN